MHDDHDHQDPRVPRGVLIAAGALLLLTIGLAAAARSARLAEEAEAPPDPPPVVEVSLRFEDRDDGAVVIKDPDGAEVEVLAPQTNGFVRGVLRGMFRTRKLEGLDAEAPFVLSREADGRFLLADPTTGREVELRSFGETNYEAFARLLDAGRAAR